MPILTQNSLIRKFEPWSKALKKTANFENYFLEIRISNGISLFQEF